MTDDTASSDTRTYLVGLYGENPQGLLWIGGHADGWKGRTFASVDQAVSYAITLDKRDGLGVYHRSTTLARVPDKRGDADDSSHVYYFALDADVAGPGHKASDLMADLDDVRALIDDAVFPQPTAWVASGGGYYPQWRFTEPIDVRDPEQREWVANAFSQMSAHFIERAKRRDWKLDNVRDLARVFRLPGTMNRKVPGAEVMCTLNDAGGETYDLGLLAWLARPRTATTAAGATASTAVHNPVHNPSDDDLFDTPGRHFTRKQATAFVNEAGKKLKATESGFNNAINAFAMACAHFPWLVDRDKCAELMMRWLGTPQGWDAPDANDTLTIESAYRATEAGKSWVAIEKEQASGDGQESEVGDELPLPAPGQPVQVARELITRMPASDGVPHWSWWRDDFYRWTGAHWDVTEQSVVEQWLYQQTADAHYLTPPKKEGEPPVPVPWAPTRKKIGDLAHALGVGELQRHGDEDRVIACANGVITLEGRQVSAHSPQRFNLFSLPFDYDPEARAPRWQEFLDSVLPGDQQAQDFLGEWFGYVISGRTDQHKIAALIGKKRSGKGTIARVLSALIGKGNVVGLNLNKLAGTFGLEPFVGAALAVASDVRWKSRAIGDAVQILLEVSGEDTVPVDRKNKKTWNGRLGVRFMLMSNDTPTFSDRSGALVDRMIYVSFKQSFFGREDIGLTEKLLDELPGIFNWALDGLERLDGRGRFTQPESGEHEAEATRRLADPVGAFIEDWCEVEPEAEISLDHLYLKFRLWCESEGRDRDSTTKEIFSRDVRSKVDGITSRRTREEGKFVTMLKGITSSAL